MNTIILITYTLVGIIFAPGSDDVDSVETTKGMPTIEICSAKMDERKAIRIKQSVEAYFVCIPVSQAVQRPAVTKEKKV